MGEEFLGAGLVVQIQPQAGGRRQIEGEQQRLDVAAGSQLKAQPFSQGRLTHPALR